MAAAPAAMQTDETRTSSSGLEFKLHPLVLINLSDHYTRTKANSGASSNGASTSGAPSTTKVMGILLGSQVGRTVDISNSFEIKFQLDPTTGGPVIDMPFLTHRQEQYKQTFSKLDVVGWYTTGEDLTPHDMEVNKTILNLNESPVLLLFNPRIDHSRKELPVSLFETELHVANDQASIIFVKANYTVETSDAERIGVDQVAKLSASGRATGSQQLTNHLSGLHSALKMLMQRVALVLQMVEGMRSGSTPRHEALLRQVHSLVASLPALDSERFNTEYLKEYNDALLTVMLAAMTQGMSGLADTVEKVQVAFGGRGKGRVWM